MAREPDVVFFIAIGEYIEYDIFRYGQDCIHDLRQHGLGDECIGTDSERRFLQLASFAEQIACCMVPVKNLVCIFEEAFP